MSEVTILWASGTKYIFPRKYNELNESDKARVDEYVDKRKDYYIESRFPESWTQQYGESIDSELEKYLGHGWQLISHSMTDSFSTYVLIKTNLR